jgi:phosphotransferase system  glucose/maltose/N-acetylglucosamine-specific IIC component
MNKQELMELAKTLGDNVSPQLRLYTYVEWIGWLNVMICGAVALWLIWRFREKISENVDHMAPFAALAIGGCVYALLFACFVPYTLHVFTTPELLALKSLISP